MTHGHAQAPADHGAHGDVQFFATWPWSDMWRDGVALFLAHRTLKRGGTASRPVGTSA